MARIIRETILLWNAKYSSGTFRAMHAPINSMDMIDNYRKLSTYVLSAHWARATFFKCKLKEGVGR